MLQYLINLLDQNTILELIICSKLTYKKLHFKELNIQVRNTNFYIKKNLFSKLEKLTISKVGKTYIEDLFFEFDEDFKFNKLRYLKIDNNSRIYNLFDRILNLDYLYLDEYFDFIHPYDINSDEIDNSDKIKQIKYVKILESNGLIFKLPQKVDKIKYPIDDFNVEFDIISEYKMLEQYKNINLKNIKIKNFCSQNFSNSHFDVFSFFKYNYLTIEEFEFYNIDASLFLNLYIFDLSKFINLKRIKLGPCYIFDNIGNPTFYYTYNECEYYSQLSEIPIFPKNVSNIILEYNINLFDNDKLNEIYKLGFKEIIPFGVKYKLYDESGYANEFIFDNPIDYV